MSSMSDIVASYKLFKFWDGYLVNLASINSKIGGLRIKDSYFFSWGAFSVYLFFGIFDYIFPVKCGPWVHCMELELPK